MLRKSRVERARIGSPTSLERGVLTVDAEKLRAELLAADGRIEEVAIHVALPGESTRILCTKDVIEPRCKPGGDDIGEGTTHLLENAAVVTCGPIVGFQEGIIDMSGPGAEHTPFSTRVLVVVEIEVKSDTGAHDHERAMRSAGLRAAEYLASACAGLTPDHTEQVCWDEAAVDSALPRIAYVNMVLTQGLLHDTYILGRDAREVAPCLLDPRVLVDGGIVSGN